MKKEKILSALVVVIFALVLLHLVYSFAEERIALTVYYPAPYGFYRDLRTDQMSVGSIYGSSNLYDGKLVVNGSMGVGTVNLFERLEVVDGAIKTAFLDFGVIESGQNTLYFGNQSDHWGGLRRITTPGHLILFSEGNRNITLIPYNYANAQVSIPRVLSIGIASYDYSYKYPLVIKGAYTPPVAGTHLGYLQLNSALYGDTAMVMGLNTSAQGWITPFYSGVDLYLNQRGRNTQIAWATGSVGIGARPTGPNQGVLVDGNVSFTTPFPYRGFTMCINGANCPAGFYRIACGRSGCTANPNTLTSDCSIALSSFCVRYD